MIQWSARLLGLAVFAAANAQTIVTVAGLPYSHRAAVDSQSALNAPLSNVHSLLMDRITGRLLFSDQTLLNRLEPDGSLVVVAGMGRGEDGDIADGTLASGLQVFGFDGLAQDPAGNLYVTAVFGDRVFRIALNGTVSTFAGGGGLRPGFASDGGPATAAALSGSRGLVFDSQGNLDIADVFCQCIRRVSPAGIISTLYSLPPPSGSKPLDYFEGLAIDAQDNIYAAHYTGHEVLKIAPDGTATTIAGTGVAGFSGDGGPATSAQLRSPSGVMLDGNGNVYIADSFNHRVRRIAPDGTISTVIGTGEPGFSGDGGPAASAQINLPAQTIMDSAGNLYLADYGNSRVRRVTPDGTITTIAGNGVPDRNPIQYPQVGDGGPALSAVLNRPSSPVFDGVGNLYVSDYGNSRVRKITPDGIITTIAGNGQTDVNYAGGGLATQASIAPRLIAFDPSGTLYIEQNFVDRVFKLNADGSLSLIAGGGEGTGTMRFQGDGGPAVNAIFNGMNGLVIDSQGNVYITDEINTRVRKVDGTTGIVTTIAGPGQSVPGVDYWGGLVADPQGNLYVSTVHAQLPGGALINRVNPDGSLTPIAGNQQPCTLGEFSYDGAQATQVPLCSIGFMSMDAHGVLYFGSYNAVLAISPDGTIRRVAGSALTASVLPHSNGDGGPVLNAEIGASGVALDAQGNMFIADAGSNRIREVMQAPVSASFSTASLGLHGSQSQTVSVQTNVAEPFPYAVSIQTDGNLPWLAANRVTGQTGDTLTVFANANGLPPGTYQGSVSVTLLGSTVATLPVTLTLP